MVLSVCIINLLVVPEDSIHVHERSESMPVERRVHALMRGCFRVIS